MTGKKKILLIEDDSQYGLYFVEALHSAFPDMTVVEEQDIGMAEHYLKINQYAAVVCNQRKSREANEGCALVKSIRERKFGDKNAKAILVLHSSKMDAELTQQGSEAGADGCFSKADFADITIPFIRDKLIERMTDVAVGGQGGHDR